MLTVRQLLLLKNSLVLAGGVTLFSLLFGVSLAFLIERVSFPFRKIVRILVPVPLLIPPYLHAIAWRFFILRFLRPSIPQLSLYNIPSAILILSFAYYPIVVLLTMFALKNIDARLEEAGSLFLEKRAVWRKITLPLVLPSIAAGAFFVFILCITNFGLPSLLHVNVFTYEIFSQFSAFFNFGKAMILSWPLLLIVIVLLTIGYYLLIKGKPIIVISSGAYPPAPIQIGAASKVFVSGFIAFLLFFSVFLPIFSFLVQAGNIDSFIFAFKSSGSVIAKSLFLSTLGATLITVVGVTLLVFNQFKLAVNNIFRLTSLLLLALPSITTGIILIKIFNRPLLEIFYINFGIIIAGFLVRFFPYASETLRAFFAQIDKKLIEAAKLTDSTNGQILRKILIPLLMPGIIAASLISFILCLTELGTTILIHPPGWQTLPIRIFVLMHYGAPELVAALSLILIAISLISFAVLVYLSKYRLRAQPIQALVKQ